MGNKSFFKDTDIYKLTARMVVFVVLMIALCRLTRGYIMPLYAFIGACCAFTNHLGWSLVFFVLMPFFAVLNPILVGNASSLYIHSLRFGSLLIGVILALHGASRQGQHRLPFIGMIPFLMVAAISSADGWAPLVSYMKLINFVVFLVGIWYGTQNLDQRPKDVLLLRSMFLALSCFVIFGSVATIAVPSVGYAMNLRNAMLEGGAEYTSDAVTLFCGVTNHSQTLGVFAPIVAAYTLSDMLFLERRFRWLHVAVIVLALPLCYMSRSRVGLLSMMTALAAVGFYAAHRIPLPTAVKHRLNNAVWAGIGMVLLVAVVAQLTSGTMSKWLRKTGDTEGDNRSLGEAVTSSRMGLIEQSMYEFRRRPLLGMGFQVAEYTQDFVARQKGLVLSAPIEKGVTPVMVLGETGIIGEFFFLVFLGTFYGVCTRRKYYVTVSLFSVFLVANLAESTFFSPSGDGGFQWIMCVVGGFTIDTYLLFRRQLEQQWASMGFQMTVPAFELVEDASGRRRLVESRSMVRRYGLKG